MMEDNKKGRVCVTGGTGFVASWMIKRLLEEGYSVNTTIRFDPECKRDISFLTNLPGASERLQTFNAELDKPNSFAPAIQGCIGVFHLAHPLDFEEKEAEDVKLKRVITGLRGILEASADSKTVRRVVYTASIATVAFSTTSDSDIKDESSWTDVEFVRSLKVMGGSYFVIKTLAEKAALEFAEELGLDLVSINPTWISGPFICSHLPDSVSTSMALIFGEKKLFQFLKDTSLIHVDDVARAHIHLFEYPQAKGRYICSAVEVKIEELRQFISARYPEYQMPNEDSWKDLEPIKVSGISSKKIQATGFKYEKGLEEIFDGAIKSCKQKGFL